MSQFSRGPEYHSDSFLPIDMVLLLYLTRPNYDHALKNREIQTLALVCGSSNTGTEISCFCNFKSTEPCGNFADAGSPPLLVSLSACRRAIRSMANLRHRYISGRNFWQDFCNTHNSAERDCLGRARQSKIELSPDTDVCRACPKCLRPHLQYSIVYLIKGADLAYAVTCLTI